MPGRIKAETSSNTCPATWQAGRMCASSLSPFKMIFLDTAGGRLETALDAALLQEPS